MASPGPLRPPLTRRARSLAVPDLATPAYKLGASLARALPERMASATGDRLGKIVGSLPSERRRIVERNVQRVRPDLDGRALRRSARAIFGYYGRYWVESFRLPDTAQRTSMPA